MRVLVAASSVFLVVFAWLGELWRGDREEESAVTGTARRSERSAPAVQLVLRRAADGRVLIFVQK